jgi:glycine C-acetyltransferase
MDQEFARTRHLGHFYLGHATDPLRPPEDFGAWRKATAREQSLNQRPLASAAGPRARLQIGDQVVDVVNLASLDYLGVNGHPRMVAAARTALERWGTGACGVPLLSGTTEAQKELERETSALLGRGDTAVFTSGFSGGVGLLSALLHRGDVAIADEKAHMCWLDGIRTAGARRVTYAHEDPVALDRTLAAHRDSRRVVIVDGLYSMDGDVARLPEILDVCESHGVGLIVDEAHSIFALGQNGGGATEAHDVEERVALLFGTYSKGIASLGGFVSGAADLLDYARFYAHPYGFSAALPPAVSAANLEGVRIARDEPHRRVTLAANAAYFRKQLTDLGVDIGLSTTHVVPIIVNDERALLYDAALAMLERGLYLIPIDYPAVPQDRVRFRAAISAAHTREDLDMALSVIDDCVVKPLRRKGRLMR